MGILSKSKSLLTELFLTALMGLILIVLFGLGTIFIITYGISIGILLCILALSVLVCSISKY